jgi:hypothetical protein
MLHKPVKMIVLNIAITVIIIAVGHALSYLFG